MKRSYSLAIEGEAGSYSAYVPELPAILVTGGSLDELTGRARQAIRLVVWNRCVPTSHRVRCCARSKSNSLHNSFRHDQEFYE